MGFTANEESNNKPYVFMLYNFWLALFIMACNLFFIITMSVFSMSLSFSNCFFFNQFIAPVCASSLC
jgi:hypothetical protein